MSELPTKEVDGTYFSIEPSPQGSSRVLVTHDGARGVRFTWENGSKAIRCDAVGDCCFSLKISTSPNDPNSIKNMRVVLDRKAGGGVSDLTDVKNVESDIRLMNFILGNMDLVTSNFT